MSEYYAIQRSNDCLEHYGVKGMKWGVRKAIEKGNERKLDRQYRKAQKKLEKLNSKANVSEQLASAKKHNKRAAIGLGVGAFGLGAHTIMNNKVKEALKGKHGADLMSSNLNGKPTARKKRIVGEGFGVEKKGSGLGIGPTGQKEPTVTTYKKTAVNSTDIRPLYAAIGLAGLGTAVYQKGKAIAAKRRTTQKGHAKAVAKRNAWENEMRKSFSGTKYSNLPNVTKKRRKSK